LPSPSPLLVKLFTRYTRRYLSHHFHAVRLAKTGQVPDVGEMPLVIYSNHPAWWDPLVGICLVSRLFPERRHYAPIEAQALARYRFFARLGFFGIATGTPAGARQFLEITTLLFRESHATLWITPEGHFSDPRERPVRLKPGIGHLARRLDRGAFVPLALEYPFWEERFPEALARFGETLDVSAQPRRRSHEYTELLATRLDATQDALAREAKRRDRQGFQVLLSGKAGIGGSYDMWRRLRALVYGERFQRKHGAPDL
jgi:1-acyl-sn-glycerol-3-phosphate acyltransferase